MHNPPECSKHNDANKDNRVPVHETDRVHRISIWKAEKDVEEYDQDTCHSVDEESRFTHPERSWRYALSPRKHVRKDGQEVAHGSENDE